MTSTGVCANTRVTTVHEDFVADCYIIPLDDFDVVLRVQWLHTLGPILWDFTKLTMSFWRDDHPVSWTGLDATSVGNQECAISGCDLMQELLAEFTGLFRNRMGCLPPCRHDHHIHLLLGTVPVAVRPYRYPQLLKDEIEKQCDDMLAQGIIRESTSAFSSPVLLIKKQDALVFLCGLSGHASWYFCVDYRALNDKTVNDKFSIPVADELLDELNGARFFTKLDLRSGYH